MNRDEVWPAPSDRPGSTLGRRVVRGGAAAVVLGLVGLAAPASGHVTVTPSTTAAGAFAVLEFSVGHGCEDSPTTRISIQLPPEINTVSPTRNGLWQVEKDVERLDPPVTDAHGNEITERVASVTYTTDAPLPDGYRDTFELFVQLPNAEGDTLAFPTIQTCQDGESAWIEVPQDGQDVDELELPAPSFVVGEAADEAADDKAVDEVDDEDGTALTVAALVAGLLGAVLGGTALVRQRRRP